MLLKVSVPPCPQNKNSQKHQTTTHLYYHGTPQSSCAATIINYQNQMSLSCKIKNPISETNAVAVCTRCNVCKKSIIQNTCNTVANSSLVRNLIRSISSPPGWRFEPKKKLVEYTRAWLNPPNRLCEWLLWISNFVMLMLLSYLYGVCKLRCFTPLNSNSHLKWEMATYSNCTKKNSWST